MVYIQKNVPPPNNIIPFSLNSFNGGLNNRSSQLEANQASDLINMSFVDEELMHGRYGTTAYDAVDLPSSVLFIDEYKPYDATAQLLRCTSTELYSGSAKIATVSNAISGANYMGKYYFVDGAKINLYGTFPQADNLPHVDVIGTPVNADIVMQLVNPPAGYTPLGATYDTGVWKYDYTNLKCWYEPCENEIADTYKGENVLPVNPSYIAVHQDRLYISGSSDDDDNVFITDIMNGFYCPVFLPIQLPPNGDKVVGLFVFHDSIIVGRNYDIHVIYGNTNRTDLSNDLFRLKRVNTHTGFASHNAVSIAHNYMFFAGHDGNMYAMHTTQTNVDILATQILNHTIDIEKAPISVTNVDLASSYSVFFNDIWYVSIGDKLLLYSYRHRSWTLYKFTDFSPTSLYIKGYDLIIGINTGVSVKIDNTKYSDLGKPYQSYWSSKVMDYDQPSVFKQFREFFIVADTFSSYDSDINFTFEVDYIDVKDTHTIQNQISVWGKSKWGDRFINRNIVTSLPIIIGRRGRTLRVTFSNGYFPHSTVATKADLDNVLGKEEGMLVYVTDESAYYLYTDFSWVKQTDENLFQPMKVREVNGEYELRGKR